jgi:acyl-CoA thioesterase FadM
VDVASHIGYPGFVYGGTIASVVDCHAIWTALATECRGRGLALAESNPPPFAFVTGKLGVSYLKPAAIDLPLELHAHVVDRGERSVTVACRVLQGDLECASAEVVTVRVNSLG